ncbi:DUF3619 family protein [Ramlibacter sp. AW1]|uniref:DUF3619 family protein n=1 Tax=Ramlibacter aurantiacus TaxID=2801330 RepID=A0A936ZMS6_9BURK|nr:DUF3619 family protein [Ramlibacter aurantiacus]MBL0420556.1 DUF3619 family protein [Ramlibacter aurantiacus]
MKTDHANRRDIAADAFGQRVAARLGEGIDALPYATAERLRAAREQALARRKRDDVRPLRVQQSAGADGRLGVGDRALGLWGRLVSAVPLLALVAGLVAIQLLQTDARARQVAEVDAALLTDELPPAAYTDPGFLAFLRREQ